MRFHLRFVLNKLGEFLEVENKMVSFNSFFILFFFLLFYFLFSWFLGLFVPFYYSCSFYHLSNSSRGVRTKVFPRSLFLISTWLIFFSLSGGTGCAFFCFLFQFFSPNLTSSDLNILTRHFRDCGHHLTFTDFFLLVLVITIIIFYCPTG